MPSAASSSAQASPLRVVCIIGHHKSGGTPFGTLLGSQPAIFFAGELYRFPSPLWVPGDSRRLCSCGKPVVECPFWSDVRRRAEPGSGLTALKAGQIRFERWGGAPGTLLRIVGRNRALRDHADRMLEFVRGIADAAGTTTVVDQCQNALRASLYRLGRSPGVDVRYIHLVRDGRGFLYSELNVSGELEFVAPWTRMAPVASLRWAAMNLLSMLLCGLDSERYLRIRYEDLVENPAGTLGKVSKFLGVDLSETAGRLARAEPIPMRHVASGNRVRLTGSIVLREDTRWQAGLSRHARRLFWLLAGWLAWGYGYRPRISPPSRDRGSSVP